MDSKSEEYEEIKCSEQVRGLSGRKKKKMYTKLQAQMEFYFSDSNLVRDKYLYNRITNDVDGYVDLEVFKFFNKVKAITDDINIIVAALRKSTILEVSEDKTKVRRKDPINISKDFDACTLYVEGLPTYADQKWIRNIFETFGTVEYINIPRFNISQKIKGFAFIEFSSPESVVKACQFYKTSKEKEDQDKNGNIEALEETVNNADEISTKKNKRIDVGLEDNATEKKDKKLKLESDLSTEQQNTSRKRKRKAENLDFEGEKTNKKFKGSDNEKDIDTSNIQNDNLKVEEESMNVVAEQDENGVNGNMEDEPISKSKKKRRHLKKNRNRHERTNLRVMTKFEWKSYRNKYLDLQRTTMSYLKQQIVKDSEKMREQESNLKVDQAPKKELHINRFR